ncbi:MAG: hypothetical protein KTV77_00195 [Wolbachia endosymbiont of Fragariocoptes setiger]|nr:hypothetical protein [Wolbachia endosymbiont of Fragariocoptes setiger]
MERNNVGNYSVERTYLYKFDITEIFQDIKRGLGTNEYLLSDNEKSLIFSTEKKISFLYNIKDMKKIAFIEHDDSEKILHLRDLSSGDDFTYNIKDEINNLCIIPEKDFIVISIFNINGITSIVLNNDTKVVITPRNAIDSVNKLLSIIHGRLEENNDSSNKLEDSKNIDSAGEIDTSQEVTKPENSNNTDSAKEIDASKWYMELEEIKSSQDKSFSEAIKSNIEYQNLQESQDFNNLEKSSFTKKQKIISEPMNRLVIKSVVDKFSPSDINNLAIIEILFGLMIYKYVKRYRR